MKSFRTVAKTEEELLKERKAEMLCPSVTFTLQATDPLAAELVEEWAKRYREKHIAAGTQGRELASVINKHASALEIAQLMRKYRESNGLQ